MFTQATETSITRRPWNPKMAPVSALLVTLGRNSLEPPSSLADDGSIHFPVETGVSEAALLLIKEKNNRYSMIRVCIFNVTEVQQVFKNVKYFILRGCAVSQRLGSQLVTLSHNSQEPPSSLADNGSIHYPVETGVSEAALLLIKEKNNLYSVIRVRIQTKIRLNQYIHNSQLKTPKRQKIYTTDNTLSLSSWRPEFSIFTSLEILGYLIYCDYLRALIKEIRISILTSILVLTC